MLKPDLIFDQQRNWQAAAAGSEYFARKFATQALEICTEAITVLSKNLNSLGYAWTKVERITSDTVFQNVEAIEAATGQSVPPVLVKFWQTVGGVSLVDLKSYRHVDFWEDQGIRSPAGFCDGLHVETCSDEWSAYILRDYADWQENFPPGDPEPFLLSLSPDGYHKDDISGGAPYGVFPGDTWLPTWQYFEWAGPQRPLTAPVGPPDFLSYLRTTILECAGFPAFLGLTGFDPIRERLLQGVALF